MSSVRMDGHLSMKVGQYSMAYLLELDSDI